MDPGQWTRSQGSALPGGADLPKCAPCVLRAVVLSYHPHFLVFCYHWEGIFFSSVFSEALIPVNTQPFCSSAVLRANPQPQQWHASPFRKHCATGSCHAALRTWSNQYRENVIKSLDNQHFWIFLTNTCLRVSQQVRGLLSATRAFEPGHAHFPPTNPRPWRWVSSRRTGALLWIRQCL